MDHPADSGAGAPAAIASSIHTRVACRSGKVLPTVLLRGLIPAWPTLDRETICLPAPLAESARQRSARRGEICRCRYHTPLTRYLREYARFDDEHYLHFDSEVGSGEQASPRR